VLSLSVDIWRPVVSGGSQSLTAQVQALFAGGKVGGMWDFGDTATLFQDTAGATPVTAVTQPIGIVLDKSQGVVRGVEKVTGNTATFDTGVGSWIGYNSATIAAVGGELQITQNAINGRATIRLPCTVGVVCEVSADVRSINGVACALGVGIYSDGNGATFAPTTTSATFTRQTLRMKSTDANPAFINITVGCNGGGTGIFAIDNVSVRELPGNHATQSTAGARPLFSARKNLLTKTEVFTDAIWTVNTTFSTFVQTTAPDASSTAALFTGDGTSNVHLVGQVVNPGGNTISVKAKAGTARYLQILFDNVANSQVNFDLQLGTFSLGAGAVSAAITAAEGGYYRCTAVSAGNPANAKFILVTSLAAGRLEVNTISGSINLWQPQVEAGTTATTYQRVNTASDYDTVGFPAFARFDGVDDSLTVGAITLGANMDCFVAVRRNAATKFMIGSGTTNSAKWFAVVENGSAGAADDSVGIAATYVVDGAPINGGLPIVTRGQLAAALPIGGWHVIEVRNLDLSTWSSLYFSGFSGFPLDGEIGGVVLCAAQSTANRNLVRRYLGAKVGLTL